MPTLGEIRAVGKPLDERSDRTGYIWLLESKVLHPYSPFPIPHSPPSPETVLSKTDVKVRKKSDLTRRREPRTVDLGKQEPSGQTCSHAVGVNGRIPPARFIKTQPEFIVRTRHALSDKASVLR